MDDTDFKQDLEYGKVAENFVLQKIQKKYPQAFIVEGKVKGYDIYIPEVNLKVEVKHDKYTKTTGNIAVETSSSGFRSGINTTLAQWYGFVTDGKVYFARTEYLLYIISANPFKHKTVKKDRIAEFVLIPLRFITDGY